MGETTGTPPGRSGPHHRGPRGEQPTPPIALVGPRRRRTKPASPRIGAGASTHGTGRDGEHAERGLAVPNASQIDSDVHHRVTRIRRKLFRLAHALDSSLARLPGPGIIQRVADRVDGGRDRLIEYVFRARQDKNPSACSWWAVWDELTAEQQNAVALEDICAVSAVPIADFMAMITRTGVQHELETADIVAASYQPELTVKLAKSGLRIEGEHAEIAMRDRHALLQARGSLPVPRNASMHVTVNANANASAKAASAAASDSSIPSFMADVHGVQKPKERIQRQLIGVVEGEVDE